MYFQLSYLARFALDVLAAILTVFLYFRSGRRELFSREALFDFSFWVIVGALFGGRIIDFLIRSDFYNWSFKKLKFFNAFSGFDIWGAVAGGIVSGYLFIRVTKGRKHWVFFDLLASPLALGASIVSVGLFFADMMKSAYGVLSLAYLIIFWAIKRLERIKRHGGFFICFFVVSVSLINIAVYPLKDHDKLIFGRFQYQLAAPLSLALIFAIIWIFASKRKIKEDMKGTGALTLLLIFKVKRVLTSVVEANNLAKSLILLPLAILKLAYYLVLLTGREIYQSLNDFAKSLGYRK